MGELPVLITAQDAGVPTSQVGQQVTIVAAAPNVANQLCYVVGDGGADRGVYIRFNIPQVGYGTAPQFRIKGILDGTPSNGNSLGFGVRILARGQNAPTDLQFAPEDTAQNPDLGGTGSNHFDKDQYEQVIPVSVGDYSPGEAVYGHVYLKSSLTTYTGNLLLTETLFEFTDA